MRLVPPSLVSLDVLRDRLGICTNMEQPRAQNRLARDGLGIFRPRLGAAQNTIETMQALPCYGTLWRELRGGRLSSDHMKTPALAIVERISSVLACPTRIPPQRIHGMHMLTLLYSRSPLSLRPEEGVRFLRLPQRQDPQVYVFASFPAPRGLPKK